MHTDPNRKSLPQSFAFLKLCEEVGKAAVNDRMVQLVASLELIQHLRGGVVGGSWLDGLSEGNRSVWKAVSEHGSNTIMKDKEVAKMKPNLDKVKEALGSVGPQSSN